MEQLIVFDAFCLDLDDTTLRHGDRPVALTPKAVAMLRYLVERPGRLITKEELLTALWPGVCVSDAVLKVNVREIRRALRDDARQPRFIATMHRRGYRFIARAARREGGRDHSLSSPPVSAS
jgi:DNA-binding winged helix-turn-helix (wHTH) protein